jgi:predicted amidohydrolase
VIRLELERGLARMNTPGTIRVAAVQMEPKLGRIRDNLERIKSGLSDAAAAGARLAVFPECGLAGYGFGSREEGLAHAVSIDGPEVTAVARVVAQTGCACVFGLLESDGSRLFNACVLVGRDGVIASYRKIHLPFLGIDMFADPGDRPLAVHELDGLRVGMHICYDGSFPESARVMTLLGADLVLLPTNWPTHSECAAEHMIPTRAMENNIYVMAVNRVGEESGFRFIGASSIADPSGMVLARAGGDAEETLYADVDPSRARNKHLVRVPGRHQINRIADRRPEFYGPLVDVRLASHIERGGKVREARGSAGS